MATKKKTGNWKTYFKGRRSAKYFLEQYFRYHGIKNPKNSDIVKITKDELMSSYISVITMYEILLFQQLNGKKIE